MMEFEELAEMAQGEVLDRVKKHNNVPYDYTIYVGEEIFEDWLCYITVGRTTKEGGTVYGLTDGMFPFDVDVDMEIEDGYRIEKEPYRK